MSKWRLICSAMGEYTMWWLWLLMLGIPTLWALIGVFVHFGVLDEESPSWVQAIGSIGAIFVAIAISHEGHRKEQKKIEKAEAFEKFRVTELACQSVYECQLAVESLKSQVLHIEQLNIRKMNAGRLDRATDVLQAVLQQRLPIAVTAEVFKVLAHCAEVSVDINRWTVGTVPEDYERYLNAHGAAIGLSYSVLLREYLSSAEAAGRPNAS